MPTDLMVEDRESAGSTGSANSPQAAPPSAPPPNQMRPPYMPPGSEHPPAEAFSSPYVGMYSSASSSAEDPQRRYPPGYLDPQGNPFFHTSAATAAALAYQSSVMGQLRSPFHPLSTDVAPSTSAYTAASLLTEQQLHHQQQSMAGFGGPNRGTMYNSGGIVNSNSGKNGGNIPGAGATTAPVGYLPHGIPHHHQHPLTINSSGGGSSGGGVAGDPTSANSAAPSSAQFGLKVNPCN